MLQIVLHPGFQKTATTTIQRVAAEHPDVIPLGAPFEPFSGTREFNEILLDVSKPSPDNGRLSELLTNILQNINDGEHKSKVLFLSNEGFASSLDNKATMFFRYEMAKRLFDMFPNGKVLFTIRNQYDAIRSFYKFSGKYKYSGNLEYLPLRIRYTAQMSWPSYLDWQWSILPSSDLMAFNYSDTIKAYISLFGSNRIQVLPYEYLRDSYCDFMNDLSNVLNVAPFSQLKPVRERSAQARRNYASLARFLPFKITEKKNPQLVQICRRILDRVPFLFCPRTQKLPYNQDQCDRLHQLYSEGNRSLCEKFNLPLDDYGYPL